MIEPVPSTSPRFGRRGVLALGLGALAVGAIGCTKKEGAVPSPEAAANSGFPRTVTHALGQTTLDKPPVRIAALDGSYVDATLLLGGQLVGYTLYRPNDNPFKDYLGDVSALTAQAKNVGTLDAPRVEDLLAQEPDLIITAKVRQGAMYPQLSKVAPTVMSETTGPTWKQNIVLLGEAMGKKELAEQKIAEYQTRAKQVGQQILAQRPEATCLLVRFASEQVARLYSSTSFFGEIMRDMGIPRPQGAPDTDKTIFVPLAPENLLQADADRIFLATVLGSGTQKPEQQREAYQANPLWNRLKGEKLQVSDTVFVSSVSVQGAMAVIDEVAKSFGVTPPAR